MCDAATGELSVNREAAINYVKLQTAMRFIHASFLVYRILCADANSNNENARHMATAEKTHSINTINK